MVLSSGSTHGFLGLEQWLDPLSRTVVRLYGLERRLDHRSSGS
ncbi:unnamed protein product [Musa textilis]